MRRIILTLCIQNSRFDSGRGGPARPVDVRLGPTEAERRGNVQWTFPRFKSCRIDASCSRVSGFRNLYFFPEIWRFSNFSLTFSGYFPING